jgi:TetR/AcrR family transcriptional repressor of mexJK operon
MTNDPAALARPALRRKGRPNLDQAADIERAIRAAALDVLMEHGEAATLNAVAQAAGISRKSLYARYANKSDLFIEVIRDIMREPQAMPYEPSGQFEHDLHIYIHQMLNVVTTEPSLTIQRLLAVDPAYIRALKPDMQASLDRIFSQPLKRLISAAQARGQLRNVDADATAKVVVALIFSESQHLGPDDKTGTPINGHGDYARFLADLVCNGLLPRDFARDAMC